MVSAGESPVRSRKLRPADGAILIGLLSLLAGSCGGGGGPSSPSRGAVSSTTTTTTTAPPASTTSTTTSTVAPVEVVLREAVFESANGYSTEGRARIVRIGGSHSLEFLSDFRTSQSPALDVRLCRDTNCRGASLALGDLKAFSGEQSYVLPDAGGSYSHVVVFCRAVQLAFGAGVLR